MNFEKLTYKETKIWNTNLKKVIDLMEVLKKYWKDRNKLMEEQYYEHYMTGWKRLFYDDSYYIKYDGSAYIFNGLFFLGISKSKVIPLTKAENKLRYFYGDINKKINEYYKVQERWAKYATQPFEIHESDVKFYQSMKSFHHDSLQIAKSLGIEYEAFNLDEDRKDSRG